MADVTVRGIIENLMQGQIRIPAFQRGFVWDADMVAYFMDSLYKGYPFGSILFWRTKERLKYERKLGPFELPDHDPDFPIDYILDGQQRITSIFGVFQTELAQTGQEDWMKVYFDFRDDPDAQESQFLALTDDQFDPDRHFPLRTLFDTTAYRNATKNFTEDIAEQLDRMQSVFKETRIPVETLATNDRTTVAIVFERINQRSIPLDTLQLLSAWTWSDEFDLQRKFEDLASELEPFGFHEVGEDTDLLLRCCAAVIAENATVKELVSLNGTEIRERFQEIINGLKGALDFLKNNLKISSLDNLPYPAFLIPLSAFFAIPGNQHVIVSDEARRILVRWFWHTCFSRRYNSQTVKTIQSDVVEVLKLKRGEATELSNASLNFRLHPSFFTETVFRMGNVLTKTTILLLAQKHPYSFISGSPITLNSVLKEYNKNEFHHLYPQAYLKGQNFVEKQINCLANFCFLSKADNVRLSGNAPSIYRSHMPENVDEILQHALCPPSLFEDNYNVFLPERAQMLADEANKLFV